MNRSRLGVRTLGMFDIDAYQRQVAPVSLDGIDFDAFRSVIEQMGNFWLVVNQPPPSAAFGD